MDGYQFVHWSRHPGELVYARGTDLVRVIKDVHNALYDLKGNEGTLLAMSARNEKEDNLIDSGFFRGHSKIKIQPVASSAGGAAMMVIVAQPYRGHSNGMYKMNSIWKNAMPEQRLLARGPKA